VFGRQPLDAGRMRTKYFGVLKLTDNLRNCSVISTHVTSVLMYNEFMPYMRQRVCYPCLDTLSTFCYTMSITPYNYPRNVTKDVRFLISCKRRRKRFRSRPERKKAKIDSSNSEQVQSWCIKCRKYIKRHHMCYHLPIFWYSFNNA
jgi:hypothetical protein